MNETLQLDLVWMTLLLLTPGVFALGVLFFRQGQEEHMRWWALLGAAASLGLALSVQTLHDAHVLERLGVRQDRSMRERASLAYRAGVLDLESSAHAPDATPAVQPARSDDWIARVPWVARFNVFYYVGVDGISASLLVVTAALVFVVLLASWGVRQFVRSYLCLILLLEMALFGTFLSLDFFLFYVFWGLVLLPAYLLIGLWGGPDRYTAAMRFFLFGSVGSVLVLLALVGLYLTNVRDFVHPDVVESAIRRQAEADPSDEPMAKKLERAQEQAVVNTFDLLTWQRAGRAALQQMRGEPVTQAPALLIAAERLAEAKRNSPGSVAALEADLERARKGLQARLETEPFFQRWFQWTLFGALFLGFALQLPIVPLHFWWPTVQVETLTPVSMLLSGALPLLGGYGLLRVVYPLCPGPAEELSFWVGLLGVVTLVYGDLAALGQDDLKKLVAYCSIAQMGFVLLGLSAVTSADRAAYWAWGANGALFVLIAHAVTAAGLYYVVGILSERVKHRRLDLMGGLAEPMPATTGLAAVLFFAALGLPGLCGFVGPVMVLIGSWNASWLLTSLALLTLMILGGTLVGTYQRIFFGTNPRWKNVVDVTPMELTICLLLIGLSVLLGVWPGFFLDTAEPSVTGLIDTLVRVPPPLSPPG